MDKKLKTLLQQAEIEDLQDLVADLYGRDRESDRMIESHLLRNDATSLGKHILQRINTLKRGRTFIGWNQTYKLSTEIDLLVNDIATLSAVDSKQSFTLIDKLIDSHEKVYQRADDSSGMIGESYRAAVKQWLHIAQLCRQQNVLRKDWPMELLKRHTEKNGYAVWDYVLDQSKTLLTTVELNALVTKYETQLEHVLKHPADRFDVRYLSWLTGLKGLATALADAELYARAITRVSPEPNSFQIADIIEFCLANQQPKLALEWHQRAAWGHTDDRRFSLLDNIYQALGDNIALLKLRRMRYQQQPSFEHLNQLAELVDPMERAELFEQAADVAMASPSLAKAMNFLAGLDRYDLVAERILQHPEQLADMHYGGLLDFAKTLVAHDYHLAASLCYRALLDDILLSGRSNAYDHAARYYKKLTKLAPLIDSYGVHISHSDYVAALRSKHGRKSGFWGRVS